MPGPDPAMDYFDLSPGVRNGLPPALQISRPFESSSKMRPNNGCAASALATFSSAGSGSNVAMGRPAGSPIRRPTAGLPAYRATGCILIEQAMQGR
jgi:hypothetical protein